MNVVFLTLSDFNISDEQHIYADLLRYFAKKGHNVSVISPKERRYNEDTHLITEDNCKILKLKIGNIQKTGIIEKGISTILLESRFKSGFEKYFGDVKFDLVLYSTPPITLAGVVKYIKKRDNAKTYLLLKDIFPQNAVDIGMMTKTGVKSIIYKVFRRKEKQLYKLSDYIGCMSQANVDYIIKNNSCVNADIVEISPNSIEVTDMSIDNNEREKIRKKYDIPLDKRVFVYGGNLGKPQGIDFLIECLRSQKNNEKSYFLIVGNGTEYKKLESYIKNENQINVKLMKLLPKEDYDNIVAASDVGMIFLDHRFTIPNFPSRILSYMQARIPILACTDPNTDIGKIIVEGGFGWWCESNDIQEFDNCIKSIEQCDLKTMGDKAFEYCLQNYNVVDAAEKILGHFG